MKIGFSFGRCLRDIVKGVVAYDDVYLIVSRTAIMDSSHVLGVVENYLNRPDYLWDLDEATCIDVGERLYLDGKLFQPRVTYGRNPRQVAEDMIWMDLSPTIMGDDQNAEQVLQAWKNYQLALKMTTLKKFPSRDLRDDF